MKITNIVGSPRRNSNSKKIASKFLETAEQNGAIVSTHMLNDLNIKGCQGCYGCKMGHETCIIKDDLDAVLQEIADTDTLVISTPIYAMDVPGQVKSFIDRLYSFLKPDFMNESHPSRLSEGKKAIFIQTQGAGEEMFKEVPIKYQQILSLFGFSEVKIIRAVDLNDPKKEVESNILNEAKKLALSLS